MAIEQANNQGENRSPNEDERAVQAFLQLGHVLAEIADTSNRHWDTERLHEKSDSQDEPPT